MSVRNELFEKIMAAMLGKGMDIEIIKEDIRIILSGYEVQERSTEVALNQGDRNKFLVKKFIVAKTVKGCSDRTIDYYGKTLLFILERIGKMVDDINADDIRLYLAVRQKRDGITKTSADNELRVLRTFYTFLFTEELILKNPTLRIDKIKHDTQKESAFTELEVEKIRSCLRNARERAVVETLLSTGCRVTELVQMKIAELKGNSLVVHGKGGKDRTVYLNAKAQLALENYLEERDDDNSYIFCGSTYRMLGKKGKGKKEEWYKDRELVGEGAVDKGSIEQMMKRIGKRCGVEGVHPHRFRKTCATMALKHGMPIEKVSKMLGHEQLDTTKIYISIGEDELEQAHKKYVI